MNLCILNKIYHIDAILDTSNSLSEPEVDLVKVLFRITENLPIKT